MTLGSKIFDLRKKNAYSKEEFASLIKIDIKDLELYEDDIKEPSIEELKRIASVCNINISYLFDDDTKNNQESNEIIDAFFNRSEKLVKRHWQKLGYYNLAAGIVALLFTIIGRSMFKSFTSYGSFYNFDVLKTDDIAYFDYFFIFIGIIASILVISGICMIILDLKKRKTNN